MQTPLCKALAGVGLLAATLIATGAHAADAAMDAGAKVTPAKRPKICLALSGGGARGAAHIGVLKVLEQYRVPIDCIAGTSMGSLVGAAYATGMTVQEMDEITGAITTELLFKENPPREELSMQRKMDDYTLLFGPELGLVDKKLKFPKGVVTGVQLETVLRKLSKVKGFQRFDDLAIPFRAVATDLVTGKAVVFKEGELANVMRASMSVPGAVAPAEFGGMILVDGMLTENLPVQVARSMGADIVIAVNVGTPLLKRDQLDGIFGVAGQMVSILTEQNVQASIALLKPTDLLISPELGNYTTADFDALAKIAVLGEPAAEKVAGRLKGLSLPPAAYAELRKRQTVAPAPDLRKIDEIRVVDLKRVNPETVIADMETVAGQPINQEALDRDMRRIYGTGDFEHVNYTLIDGPGKRVLAVDAVEKTWGPDYVRFGLGLSSDFSSQSSYFNLAASYRKTWINSLGASWRNMVQFGFNNMVASEFYQPLNAEGDYFVAPNISYLTRPVYLYQGRNNVASYNFSSAQLGLALGANFKRYGELRVGLVGGGLKPQLETGPVLLAPDDNRIHQGAVNATLLLDRLDNVHFPRSGWRFGASLYSSNTGLGADQSYNRWTADGTAAYSVGDHTFNVAFKAGGKLGGKELPAYSWFQWGGFLQQSGYKTGQLYGNSMTYGRAMYYHRIMRGTMLDGAYGGVSLEMGRYGVPLLPDAPSGVLTSGSLFIGADTPIGPAYLGYGRAADGNQSFYFFLGKAF
ncbi:MAG: patatin-like phospholipase family protein [Comamonadaceae bacterium]|jgi:NTE family protein|nr:patatin-like phospholipase family protein [Comamonadaceae bacterium]MBP8100721.1 patatin-like phospholipase family protein [Burkholderiaceae bacterium]